MVSPGGMPKLSVENGRVFVKLGEQVLEVFVEEVRVDNAWGNEYAKVHVSLGGTLPSPTKQGGLFVMDSFSTVGLPNSGPPAYYSVPPDDSPPIKASRWGSSLQGPHPSKCTLKNCVEPIGSYNHMVTHLNDAHRWTFDEIADFIEQNGYDIVVGNREEGGAA